MLRSGKGKRSNVVLYKTRTEVLLSREVNEIYVKKKLHLIQD